MTIIYILLLLFFSFFFSSLEAAIFSLNPYKLLYFQSTKRKAIRVVFNSKNIILITILLSNTFVNVFLSQIAEKTYGKIFPAITITIITTFFILLFGEYSPKIFGIKKKNIILKYFLPLFYIIYFLEYPVNYILSKMFSFREVKSISRKRRFVEDMLEIGVKDGIIQDVEFNFAISFITLSNKNVKEFMIPKEEYYFISENSKSEDIISFIPNNVKRFPVYRKDPENIIGIIDIKDIICEKGEIKKYIKNPIFVEETATIGELLKYIKKTKEKMLLIIDEKRKLKGVVDLESIERKFVESLKN